MTPRRLLEIDAGLAAGRDPATYEPELWRAAEADAGDAPAVARLARCLLQRGAWAQAISAYQLATAYMPSDAGLRSEFGLALASCGLYLQALAAQERALVLDPASVEARFARAQARQQLCMIDRAIADYDAVLAARPDMTSALGFRLMAMNYVCSDQAPLLAESRRYGALLGPATNRPTGSGTTAFPGVMRVGILSPDLRRHSITYFLQPLIDRLPKTAENTVELYLYYDNIHSDEVTQWLSDRACKFRKLTGASNEALEKLMLDDRLDVLVDLAGHFGRHRLPIFARRVAPVQVAYLGYPNTTGVLAMDWRIADPDADAGALDDFTERLAPLTTGMWAYQPPHDAPPVSPPPTCPTIGYFGLLSKITDEVAHVWSEMMPDRTRLLIKGDALDDAATRDMWLRRFIAWGFDPSRVELRGKVASTAEHLAMYADVTLAVDTWPYGGTTTTCEALWMGVPVITLEGTRHAARVGASLLRGAGLGRWVMPDRARYVAAGRRLLMTPTRVARSDIAGATWLRHDAVAAAFWEKLHELHRQARA